MDIRLGRRSTRPAGSLGPMSGRVAARYAGWCEHGVDRPEIDEPQESSIPMQCQAAARLSACISRRGGSPNIRAYSQLNWDGLSYPTSKAAVSTVAASETMSAVLRAAAVVFDTEAASSMLGT